MPIVAAVGVVVAAGVVAVGVVAADDDEGLAFLAAVGVDDAVRAGAVSAGLGP